MAESQRKNPKMTAEEAAALQSRKVLELSKTRAGIFDRNMIPFVNKNQNIQEYYGGIIQFWN